jgi:hypothetical protein
MVIPNNIDLKSPPHPLGGSLTQTVRNNFSAVVIRPCFPIPVPAVVDRHFDLRHTNTGHEPLGAAPAGQVLVAAWLQARPIISISLDRFGIDKLFIASY